MKDCLSFKGYCSGYMMYLCYVDFEFLNNDLCEFIFNLLLVEGKVVKY